MKVYIAGPMTGLKDWNFPAFNEAADKWRLVGWEVVNPAEAFNGSTDRPYRDYVEKDLADLHTCDAIALLPGWDGQNARGSVWERYVAETVFGIPVFDALQPELPETIKKPTVLEEANRLVYGARQADYGHPIEDFTRTGRMWGAILGSEDIDPAKVALCMAAVKISRECNKPKRDNAVDLAGYAGTLGLVRERQGAW